MSSLIILSGGLDSAVLLYELLSKGEKPLCLSFYYGQKHKAELSCAANLATDKGCEWNVVDIEHVGTLLNSSLTQGVGEVPEGHYTSENMASTVVPNRNMIMLSIAAGVAMSREIKVVYYAAHAGDHAIYPDCRPEFVTYMYVTLHYIGGPQIFAPFLFFSKADIVKKGAALNVPFGQTWSCYKGGPRACGKCGTCIERLEAFAANNLQDPLVYEDREWWKGQVRL
jgi:7-cyano-7-deazaguanine synthase